MDRSDFLMLLKSQLKEERRGLADNAKEPNEELITSGAHSEKIFADLYRVHLLKDLINAYKALED